MYVHVNKINADPGKCKAELRTHARCEENKKLDRVSSFAVLVLMAGHRGRFTSTSTVKKANVNVMKLTLFGT